MRSPQSIRLLFALCLLPLTWLQAADTPLSGFQILQENCFRCHSEEKRKGGLVLTSKSAALKGGDTGPAFVEGKGNESLLVKLLSPDADPHMPPKKDLTNDEIAAVSNWVDRGAKWDLASAPQVVHQPLDWAESSDFHRPALTISLSPDEEQLAYGRGNLLIIEPVILSTNGTQVKLLGHQDLVRSAAWSPDGSLLASGSFQKVLLHSANNWNAAPREFIGLHGQITALTFSPDGRRLIVADSLSSNSGDISVFNVDKGELINRFHAHDDSVSSMTLSPDGTLLATTGADKLARLWSVTDWVPEGTLEGHNGYVLSASFSPDGKRIATGSSDQNIKIWDVKTAKQVSEFRDRNSQAGVNGLHWFKDPTQKDPAKATDWVIASSEDRPLRRFDNLKDHEGAERSTGARLRNWNNSPADLTALSISEKHKLAFAGDVDGAIHQWDMNGSLKHSRSPQQTTSKPDISFRNDVLPILTRAGCSGGSCHAKAGGQNGFQLTVFSYDPRADYEEITQDTRGRRIFPGAPGQSLLLQKATQSIDHEGGQRFTKDSDFYKTLFDWIAQGAPYKVENEPTLAQIGLSPSSGTYERRQNLQLKVTAHFSDGSTRDVTHLAEYQSNNKGMAEVDHHGMVTIGGQTGEGVVLARYLGMVSIARLGVPPEKRLPESAYKDLVINNDIDRLAYAKHRELGLLISEPCNDSDFLRRASLDTIGELPSPELAEQFLKDTSTDKRSKLIDHLLNDPSWADHWAIKWGDLLRPNTQRVGVKPVYLFDRWLRNHLRDNTPYDQIVKELLTANGSTHNYGPAVLYRDKRKPEDAAEFVSQIFLGIRMDCARCHHHPNEKWGQEDYYQMAAYFSSIGHRGQGISAPISGEPEYIYFKPGGSVKHPVSGDIMNPKPPDGPFSELNKEDDPRHALVSWMTQPENPQFARAIVNRMWGEFFGKGIVHPVDDFRTSNPPSNEPLLDWLAKDFVEHHYDLKHLMSRILNSQLYQVSSIPNESNLTDETHFTRFLRRRLPAEVMMDAVSEVTGIRPSLEGLPKNSVAKKTWNQKMSSTFLDTFGRPDASAECPCERDPSPTIIQMLHLMNSDRLHNQIVDKNGTARKLADGTESPEEIIKQLYLKAFSRLPKEKERNIALAAFTADGAKKHEVVEDLMWALLNSAEFVFNH